MKLPLSLRLTLSYLAVILVGSVIAAPLAWLAVERLYLDTQRASLLAQAQLLASALQTGSLPPAAPSPYSQTSNVLPGIHTRLIDAQGAAVIDLSGLLSASTPLALPRLAQDAAGAVTPQELLARPEIAQARQGQPASAIRRVAVAEGRRVLYAAAPVLSPQGGVAQIVYLATPLPDTQWAALPAWMRAQFAGAALAALLLAGLAGFWLARRIARPLEKLAEAAHAVAAGDLARPAPEDSPIRELAMLGQAFNTMTASLRQSDQAKTAFISDVTHELRTPLTVIKGTIETLQDGALEDLPARSRFLDSMNRETERLIRLVNDLLVLTRADAGALNLQRQPLDLGELARARAEHFQHSAGLRQVTISGPPAAPGLYPVLADADRMAQVLDNLLDNALRYAPPGSQVRLSLGREAGQVVCRVADSGAGIAPEHLPLIFERFYRADPSRGRSQGGSGLGLSIVRGLVLAHGGRVSAESQVGQGTTITFWLPAE